MDASKSFAKRRLRLSQAKVRSTTQRRGSSSKPIASAARLTISMVQLPEFGAGGMQVGAVVDAVGKQVAKPGKQLVDGLDDQHCPIAILNIGGVHLGADQQTAGIGHNVAFTAFALFGASYPRGPPLSVVLTDDCR